MGDATASNLIEIAPPCRNHPEVGSRGCCGRCEQPYCADCLVRIAGRVLCGPCKQAALRDLRRRAAAPDREAEEALHFALMGLVPCFSWLVLPFATARSVRALADYRRSPGKPGRWKALASLGISLAVLAAWLIGGLAWAVLR